MITKEQAINDMLAVWRRVARYAESKTVAIREAWRQDEASRDTYKWDCPLCEYGHQQARTAGGHPCDYCPTPGTRKCRCLRREALRAFKKADSARCSPEELGPLADAVVADLESFLLDGNNC